MTDKPKDKKAVALERIKALSSKRSTTSAGGGGKDPNLSAKPGGSGKSGNVRHRPQGG